MRESIQAGERAIALAKNIVTPLLLLQAGGDRVVTNASHFAFVRHSKAGNPPYGGVPHIIQGARHEILFERDVQRSEALNAILDFTPYILIHRQKLPPTPAEVRTHFMYHIVASDMDGTLLSPAHTLTPFARETLQQLTQLGVNFVFATGRHHIDIAQVRDSLGISAFMITSNGARVHNTAGELIFSHNVDEDIARDLYTIVHDDPEILTNVYRNDDWFMNRESPEQREFFQESVFHYQVLSLLCCQLMGSAKSISPARRMKNCCRWKRP